MIVMAEPADGRRLRHVIVPKKHIVVLRHRDYVVTVSAEIGGVD